CSRARSSQECVQMLKAFTDELSFGLARVLGSNLASGIHCQLEMTARHEIVVRILWRGPAEGMYTWGLHMHNWSQLCDVAESRAAIPAFLCLLEAQKSASVFPQSGTIEALFVSYQLQHWSLSSHLLQLGLDGERSAHFQILICRSLQAPTKVRRQFSDLVLYLQRKQIEGAFRHRPSIGALGRLILFPGAVHFAQQVSSAKATTEVGKLMDVGGKLHTCHAGFETKLADVFRLPA
ncbi:hypothetical protein, partial [Pseudomonas guariconensis]|uniref:hypothetical protein n=1 Tax=Pseudomonas guariconensis TaxID=1288410 RepID=UPI001E32479C